MHTRLFSYHKRVPARQRTWSSVARPLRCASLRSRRPTTTHSASASSSTPFSASYFDGVHWSSSWFPVPVPCCFTVSMFGTVASMGLCLQLYLGVVFLVCESKHPAENRIHSRCLLLASSNAMPPNRVAQSEYLLLFVTAAGTVLVRICSARCGHPFLKGTAPQGMACLTRS